MNKTVKRIYVDVPEEDVNFFQRVVQCLGWDITEPPANFGIPAWKADDDGNRLEP